MFVCTHTCECRCPRKLEARGIRPPGASVTGVKLLGMGVGTELRTSAIAVHVLNCRAISLAPLRHFCSRIEAGSKQSN